MRAGRRPRLFAKTLLVTLALSLAIDLSMARQALGGPSSFLDVRATRLEPTSARTSRQGPDFPREEEARKHAVSSGRNVLVERYKYLAFGKEEIYDAAGLKRSGSAVGNPIRWQGRWRDSAEGSPLVYFRARYYHPGEGRFTTRDPIGVWGSPRQFGNGYGAFGNNGINFVDPSGLSETPESAGGSLRERIRKSAGDFLAGMAISYVKNITLGAVDGSPTKPGQIQSPAAYTTGRQVGDAISLFQAGAEVVVGGGKIIAGVTALLGTAAVEGGSGGTATVAVVAIDVVAVKLIALGLAVSGHGLAMGAKASIDFMVANRSGGGQPHDARLDQLDPERVLRARSKDPKWNRGDSAPPTWQELNARITKVRADELGKACPKHSLDPLQAKEVAKMSNEELLMFRADDPLSVSGGGLTGGHHRTAEIGKRIASGDIAPDTLIEVLLHD